MFETAELGQKVSRAEFKERELGLWENLLRVQRELSAYGNFGVMIDFAGVKGAGKLALINLLNKWMDARWIVTHAYDKQIDAERLRPDFWRYWRDLPPNGQIGLYLSGRYSPPLMDYVYGEITEAEFKRRLDRIVAFEKTLADNGTLILKFWMHLGREPQKERLEALENDPLQKWLVNETDWKHWKLYDRFIAAAEQLIAQTSTGDSPWHIVEGQDEHYRSLRVGEIVLNAIETHLESSQLHDRFLSENHANGEKDRDTDDTAALADISSASDEGQKSVTILDTLSATKQLDKKEYKRALKKYTSELHMLQRKALSSGTSTVLVFEGSDAAGKGGIIRRLTRGLDAVDYKVVPFGAPTDEEQRHHYLWRFWKHIPRAGRMTIFDRSWYGRVLVERVEGFASEDEWKRAYAEINDFESQLVEHGIVLLKFWINITKEEQLARFEDRANTPHKQWKLSDEDWRNRNNWEQYDLAVHKMVQQTSTAIAPWQMVEGNCKRYSRIKVMRTVCETLAAAVADGNIAEENSSTSGTDQKPAD